MRRFVVPLLALVTCACAGADPSPTATQPDVSVGTTTARPAPSPAAAPPSSTTPDSGPPVTAPTEPSSTTLDPNAVFPIGFELMSARVTEPDGTVCEVCLWLAETGAQRSRGLMFVTDLGEADGMAFVYPRPHITQFWMKDTLLPLSIAFFGPDGRLMESFDMDPCLTDTCQRYPTPADFLVAVETYQGGLASIGMTDGSTLELLDVPCEV